VDDFEGGGDATALKILLKTNMLVMPSEVEASVSLQFKTLIQQ